MPFHLTLPVWVAMLAFFAVSVGVGAAMASAGGWRALAERYPAPPDGSPAEERYRFTSLRTAGGLVGTAAYNSCVTVGVGPGGISLALWAPFRFLHPPLFVPWVAVKSCRAVPLVWGSATEVRVGETGSFALYGRAAAAVADLAVQRGLCGRSAR